MTKKQTVIAKALFKKSLDEKGQLNPNRVRQILTGVTRVRPQGVLGILKAYRRLVQSRLKKEAVVVETAQVVKSKNLAKVILQKTGANRVIFRTNPNLTIGAKITYGDWVWDATLDAKLARLTQND